MLTSHLALPPEMQQALERLAGSLRGQFQRPAAPTLQTRRHGYRGERRR